MNAMDGFQAQALNLLTRPEAAVAFDLNREDARVRDALSRALTAQG